MAPSFMSVEAEIRALQGEIGQGMRVLERLEGRLVAFEATRIAGGKSSPEDAMVVAQYLTHYYTCLETVFLRISRHFENCLPPHRWHRELLDKMVVTIEGVRPQVIAEETRAGLTELLKFRHFTRYYFELDHDWDKLRFLLAKFHQVRGRVREELVAFERFLVALLAA